MTEDKSKKAKASKLGTNIKINYEIHKRLKICCAHEGNTLIELIEELIDRGFQSKNKDEGTSY